MSDSLNAEIMTDGTIRARRGFKSFAGMVWQLHLINRRYRKLGVKGSFLVTLPLPEGKVRFEYRTKMRKFKP